METKPINFTSRCSEIRMGQDVCHMVNTCFPHKCSTYFSPTIERINLKIANDDFSMSDTYKWMRIKNGFKVLQKKISAMRSISDNVADVLYNVKDLKVGNCSESATIANVILYLNGIKNACTTSFLQKMVGHVDHRVCVFNRDGSKFNDFMPNNTIVVDPWAGFCDFAGNAFKRYKNMYKENFQINDEYPMRACCKRYLEDSDVQGISETFPTLTKTFRK